MKTLGYNECGIMLCVMQTCKASNHSQSFNQQPYNMANFKKYQPRGKYFHISDVGHLDYQN